MIKKIAVLGAGVMGSEIAYVAATAGVEVALLDSDPDALIRGVGHAGSIAERRVKRGKMEATEATAIIARIAPTTDDADLADCGLAIEVVPERMDIKRVVMARLDAALPPEALIASNTSGLSISEMARETGRPDRVLGLHFFNPASVMKLVEVIEGESTSEETMAAGEAFAAAVGKSPVRVRECPGFLVNRILCRAMAEAYRHAADLGADRAAADRAVVDGGPAPMGPFALGDLIGLDTMAHLRKDLDEAYGERFGDGGQIDAQVADGRLGQKSGSGFFEGKPPDAEADAAGREVAERYYLGALNEAYRSLEENVAAADDVDVAMRFGCGWETGPLSWAADTGLPGLAARMNELAGDAPRLAPPPGLIAASAR
ncbi:MAG: 3-hydroxyacyl-CoA dehydrogenase family protein [Miltoncostaeaceae bacterium]